jgi:hypothetical protein
MRRTRSKLEKLRARYAETTLLCDTARKPPMDVTVE